MKSYRYFLQRGFTLIELTVVLVILLALAGLAVPYVMGTGSTAMCQTTDATMQTVKEAIDKAYSGTALIYWKDVHYRHDIGARALNR